MTCVMTGIGDRMMDEQELLERIIGIFKESAEYYRPAKTLYQRDLAGYDLPGFDEFVEWLRSQPRLMVIQPPIRREPDDPSAAGADDGPLVLLKERLPDFDGILMMLQQNVNATLENLGKAYALAANELDPGQEDMFFETLKRTKALKDEVEKMVLDRAAADQKPPVKGE